VATTPTPKAAKKNGATRELVASATAAEFQLQQGNPAEIAKLEPGDAADLQLNTRSVAILNKEGTILGYIEPRAGLRLKRMIEGGNTYNVTIRMVDHNAAVEVFIREVRRDSSRSVKPRSSPPLRRAGRRRGPTPNAPP
jgi:hypothetical protein